MRIAGALLGIIIFATVSVYGTEFRYDEVSVSGTGIEMRDDFTGTAGVQWKSEKQNWFIDKSWTTPSGDKSCLRSDLETPGSSCQVTGDRAWVDYTVEAVMYCDVSYPTIPTLHGICARVTAAMNYNRQFYFFGYDGSNGDLVLMDFNGKSEKVLAKEAQAIQSSDWHRLSISVQGDQIVCSLDGVERIRVNDSGHSKGMIGLYQERDVDTAFDEEQARQAMLGLVAVKPGTQEAAQVRLSFARELRQRLTTASDVVEWEGVISEYKKVIQESGTSPEAATAAFEIADVKNWMALVRLGFQGNETIYDAVNVHVTKSSDPSTTMPLSWTEDFTTKTEGRWDASYAIVELLDDSSAPSTDTKVARVGSPWGNWSAAVAGDENWMDYIVAAKIKVNYIGGKKAFWQGLCARVTAMTDENRQLYLFVYDGSDGELRLENYRGPYVMRKVLGKTPSGITSGGWHELKLAVIEDNIRCYFDGNEVFNVVDGTHARGKVGLYQMAALPVGMQDRLAAYQDVINSYASAQEAKEAKVKHAIVQLSFRGKARRDGAYSTLESFLQQYSEDDAITGRAHLNLAGIIQERAIEGEASYDETVLEVQRVLARRNLRDEDRATAMQLLVEAYLFQQKPEEARTVANDILTSYSFYRRQAMGAQYGIALSYFMEENYPASQVHFKKVLSQYNIEDNYPLSNHQADAMLYLARIALKQNQVATGCARLREVIDAYPDSLQAKQARELLRACGK